MRLLVAASVALVLVACGIDSRVRVEVVDEAGRPVVGASVGVVRLDGPALPQGRPAPADDSGVYQAELVPGLYRIFALADGFEQAATEVRVVGGVPLVVQLVLGAKP
jgi:hypothetical protein